MDPTYDDDDHAGSTLSPDKVGRAEQNDDSQRNRGDGQNELNVCLAGDDHNKLDGEAEEKEEIELQQRNVDLKNAAARQLSKMRRRV